MPTSNNPAEDAGRKQTVKELLKREVWFRALRFLHPAVRSQARTDHVTLMEDKRPLDLMVLQYSSRFELKKRVSWRLRFKKNSLRAKVA